MRVAAFASSGDIESHTCGFNRSNEPDMTSEGLGWGPRPATGRILDYDVVNYTVVGMPC